jgi:hypothetical protein
MWAIIEPILSWVCIFITGGTLIWAIYAGLVKPVTNPNPTTTQTGGTSYNYDIKNYPCGRLLSIDNNPVPKQVKPIADKVIATVKTVVKK